MCHIGACDKCSVSVQYIPRNMHAVFALLCFVVVIHWLIIPYSSGLLHWHCGNITIAPVPAKQPWWIWINTSIWIYYDRLHNHNKAKHNKTVCIFLGIYCSCGWPHHSDETPTLCVTFLPLPTNMINCGISMTQHITFAVVAICYT